MQVDKLTGSFGYSDVSPFDDYRDSYRGFNNDVGDRTIEQRIKWAEDTANLAKYSVYSYIIECPIKIISYFVKNSDFEDSIWMKLIAGTEKLTGTLGDTLRNKIYAHKDKDGKFDDNLGAEEFAKDKFGDQSTFNLSRANNFVQTKGTFIVAALSYINPVLANDLDWSVVNLLDGWWWRNMGTNLALGPGFSHNLWSKCKGLFSKNTGEETLSWDSIKNTFFDHFNKAKKSLSKYNNTSSTDETEKKKHLLEFCEYTDKTISTFTPIINTLNIFGDIARPLARRLGLSGFSRNSIRILSVIDRPLIWANNIFRFYIPEKFTENKEEKKHNLFSFLSSSDMLLASTLLDMGDFGGTILETPIKESSGNINKLFEMGRRASKSFEDIYRAVRRRRAAEDFLRETHNQSLYDRLQKPGSN